MSIQEIIEISKLKPEIAESLWYHSVKLRDMKVSDAKHISWYKMLTNKRYRNDNRFV